MSDLREPLIHSHVTDELPEDHPHAWTNIYCVTCNDMVHAGNNECMQTWVETGKGNYCLWCFVAAVTADYPHAGPKSATVIDDHWGLTQEGAGLECQELRATARSVRVYVYTATTWSANWQGTARSL